MPIYPVDLTDPFNNYKQDDMTEDADTVPDVDNKIKDINDFLFGDIEKKIREESSAGGSKRNSKRKTTRKPKATHKKATRRHKKNYK